MKPLLLFLTQISWMFHVKIPVTSLDSQVQHERIRQLKFFVVTSGQILMKSSVLIFLELIQLMTRKEI